MMRLLHPAARRRHVVIHNNPWPAHIDRAAGAYEVGVLGLRPGLPHVRLRQFGLREFSLSSASSSISALTRTRPSRKA